MKAARPLAFAFAMAAAGVAVHAWLARASLARYDQQVLPAYDAYVYMAMADHPGFFTVGPWGYRVLTPALVHALPLPTAQAFEVVTLGALVACGPLLFLFLRRLGYRTGPSLAGVAAFAVSPPIGAAVGYVFVTDPIALALELAFLLAVEAGAGAGALALLAAAGMLAKEVFVFFLPVVFLARRDRDGTAAALGKTAAATAGAFAALRELHAWTAYLPARPAVLPDADAFWLGVYRILAGWPSWLPEALLFGVLPLAVVGVLDAGARLFLRRYGVLLVLTLGLPFAASVYTEDRREMPFFPEDVARLLIYALPLLVPLALCAFRWSRPEAPAPPLRLPRALDAAAAFAAIACVLAPRLALDSYRRVDLRGPHDGRLLLALCRESFTFAQRLDRGRPVAYAPETRRFLPDRSDPHLLERMRWYLRDGWGRMPHYAPGAVVMTGREAGIVLPCFRPADQEIVLTLSAPVESSLRVDVNGRTIGTVRAGAEPARARLQVPADVLYRGDNALRIMGTEDGAPQARLHELVVRPIG